MNILLNALMKMELKNIFIMLKKKKIIYANDHKEYNEIMNVVKNIKDWYKLLVNLSIKLQCPNAFYQMGKLYYYRNGVQKELGK